MLLKVWRALEPVVYVLAMQQLRVRGMLVVYKLIGLIAEQYIASFSDNSNLHVAISDQVATSYDSQREVGVFSLFFTSTPKARLRKWTSDVLALDDHVAVTDSDI
ncbi:hypothetical protein PI124_g18315 [Phytophthora idaei]|nr:hypothetical protein PI125_g19078 [Phytophthora idaei]KAG3136806.1 hypothetical protein PI126_g17654 [Phytophthora idaei]KAG3236685.1 hypothetical protein PI124_g18315 [Phytophthora idaei]